MSSEKTEMGEENDTSVSGISTKKSIPTLGSSQEKGPGAMKKEKREGREKTLRKALGRGPWKPVLFNSGGKEKGEQVCPEIASENRQHLFLRRERRKTSGTLAFKKGKGWGGNDWAHFPLGKKAVRAKNGASQMQKEGFTSGRRGRKEGKVPHADHGKPERKIPN